MCGGGVGRGGRAEISREGCEDASEEERRRRRKGLSVSKVREGVG